VAAGDVADRRAHHGDDEAVRERDLEVARAGLRRHDEDCACADEHEREGPDELGRRPAEDVHHHGGEAIEAVGRRAVVRGRECRFTRLQRPAGWSRRRRLGGLPVVVCCLVE
jgi:hypothetical protein